MALSNNDQYLYVGLNDHQAVERIDLADFTVEGRIALSGYTTSYQFTAHQILPLASRPQDFVVSQNRGLSTGDGGIYAYFNGSRQSNGERWEAWSMVPASAPGVFYAYEFTDTGDNFIKARITSDGFEIVERKSGLARGYQTRIAGANDIIFASDGSVIDGGAMRTIGNVDFPWFTSTYGIPQSVVATDLNNARAYFAYGNEIAIYDAQALVLLEHFSIPGDATIKQLLRWGDDGFAALTDQGEIVLFNSGRVVPHGDVVNLKVELNVTPVPAFLNDTLTYEFRITNDSDNIAKDVHLHLILSDGQSFISSNPELAATNRLVLDIGHIGIRSGSIRTIQATANRLTTLVTRLSATSSSPDSHHPDNHAEVVLNVGYNAAPDSVREIELKSNDVIPNPADGTLIVSVNNDAPIGVANRIITLNPLDGLIVQSISLPETPGKLAVSEDGEIAYTIAESGRTIYRIDLTTGEFDEVVSISNRSFVDIETLRGARDSIAIADQSYGVFVYDDGVARTGSSGYSKGDSVELLPDPDQLFGVESSYSQSTSYKFDISDSGFTASSTVQGLFNSYTRNIESDGHYVYSSKGRSVRADLMAVDGTFPLNELNTSSYYSGATALEPDRVNQRVYFARGHRIGSFDSESHLLVRFEEYPTLSSTIATLERWGDDGFVARLQNDHIAIIRTDLVPDEPGPAEIVVNLPAVSATSGPQITITGRAFAGQGIANVTVNGQAATTIDHFSRWSATLNLSEGPNLITFVATPAGGGAPATTSRTVNYVTTHDLNQDGVADSWAAHYFPNDSGARQWRNTNEDGDSRSDFAEYVFGTNPMQNDGTALAKSASDRALTPSRTLEYRRLRHEAHRYKVGLSADLVNWDFSEEHIEWVGVTASGDPGDRYDNVRFRIKPSAGDAMFCKIAFE